MAQIVNISFPAVPHFPNGGMSYEQRYQNELNNILRLYLERLTAQLQALSGTGGGFYLQFPHVAASDTTDQYAGGNDTPTLAVWNTEEYNLGFTFNPSGSATAQYGGIYKITYSLQFANTDNAQHSAVVWLRVNGVDIARSSTEFTLQARKSALIPSYTGAYSEVVFELAAGDEVELYWATDLAATSGGVAGVYMYADPAQTVPYARPAIPSAIGSITFISGT